MCAAYRMAVERWPVDAALAEMDAFGFYAGWRQLRGYASALPARLDRLWPAPPAVPAPATEAR
jgi:hypothetical protein